MESESMAMEVEEQHPKSDNRVGLKNAIQTNFGEDYVFQIVPKNDWESMAVSLSSNAVKIYSPVTGQFFGECKGHSDTINQISFSGPSSSSAPHVLHSCSSDGTIRAWDTRNCQEVSCISAGPSQEVFSFSFGGSADNLLSAGCKSQILIWDWRNKKRVACLEDSHVEDVTQVQFIPNHPNKLLSASVDGLICVFDTDGDINDDDNLESVINVETSIGRVGFFGDGFQKLWCLTHIETLSIWDWKDQRSLANFPEARPLTSAAWNLDPVEYFVDCHFSEEAERLWVIGGTNAGSLGYFPVSFEESSASIGSAEALLVGGHKGIVRSFLPMSSIAGSSNHKNGIFGWTGGEDGRLCCWSSDNSSDSNRSWISSTMVVKSPKTWKINRHQPY